MPTPRREAASDANASSYFLFSTITVLITVPTIAITQAYPHSARIWMAVAAALLYVANFAGVVELFWREWFNPRPIVRLPKRTIVFGYEIPWRLVRLLDHYIGLSVSFSLVILAVWAFDHTPTKDHYFVFSPSGVSATNIWSVWNSMLTVAFALITVNTSTNNVTPNHDLPITLCGWQLFVAYPINVAVVTMVITRSVEAIARRREEMELATASDDKSPISLPSLRSILDIRLVDE